MSEWGHDFRPAYLELASLKDDFPDTPIACLTVSASNVWGAHESCLTSDVFPWPCKASCTPKVLQSIQRDLKLKNAVIVKASFNRPNIEYAVEVGRGAF